MMRLPGYIAAPALAAALAALVYAGVGSGSGLLSRAAALVAPRQPASAGTRGDGVRGHMATLPAVGEPRDGAAALRRPTDGLEKPRISIEQQLLARHTTNTRQPPGTAGFQPAPMHGRRDAVARSNTATHPNSGVVGTSIVVPRLGIHAPVYDRGDDGHGRLPIADGYAVTHYTFSGALGQPGNYVIYGHDDIWGSIFQHLPSMQPGDKVYLHHGTRRYTYEVTGDMVVLPNQVWVMDPTTTPTLTMISCTPLYVDSHRIVVKARLIAVDG